MRLFIVVAGPEPSDLTQDASSLDPIRRQDHDPAAAGVQPPEHTAAYWYGLWFAVLRSDNAENALQPIESQKASE